MKPSRIILISHTPIDAAGGVPRWNRDVRDAFAGICEVKHYSWADYPHPAFGPSEWEKALGLNRWLQWSRKIEHDDVVMADGFWANGLEAHHRVVSVAHGIWSHLTADDVAAGMQPEFPGHHEQQVLHRRRHLDLGKPIVAVSQFVSEQMMLQWGFKSYVINNAIDLDLYRPLDSDRRGELQSKLGGDALIVHGVNDRGNANKGWAYIDAVVRKMTGTDVMSLDEAAAAMGCSKPEALAAADMVIIPSGYEGNSYFALETMACGVPVVAYDVGLFREIGAGGQDRLVGRVLDRRWRDPESFADAVASLYVDLPHGNPRLVAERYSKVRFRTDWLSFMDKQFNWEVGL